MAEAKKTVSFDVKAIRPVAQNDRIAKHAMHEAYILPNHPARCLFTGASGSGKSTLLLNLITNPLFLCGYFNTLIVFSPSIYTDPSWQCVLECPPAENFEFHESIDEMYLLELIKRFREDVKENGLEGSNRTLVIFDDCMGEREINCREIMTLFTRGRHMNCSVWVSAQSYARIPRTVRLQCSNVFLFAPSTSELDRITEEYRQPFIKESTFRGYILSATTKPRGFVHINLQCPDRREFLREGLNNIFEMQLE